MPTTLSVTNVTAVANQIERPFNVVPLASVGQLAVSVYICQGEVGWHKHPDEDELFLVQEGVITLETERGNVSLHPEELVVVPRGLAHRSSSMLRSVVVLIRSAGISSSRNGHHRLYSLASDPPLEKVRLARVQATLTTPYQPVVLARVDDYELLMLTAQGFGPSETAPAHGTLWHAVRGNVGIEIEQGAGVRLTAEELTVLPRGTRYRLSAASPALLLTLARAGAAD